MSSLNELREERSKVIIAARELLDRAETEKRDLTTEEDAQYSDLMDKQASFAVKIEREERQVELERTLAASVQDPPAKANQKTASPEQRQLAALNTLFRAGVHGMGQEEQRALQVTPDSGGGYMMMPEVFVSSLIKAIDDMTYIRQWATKFSVPNSDTLGAPSLEANPADADWTTELAIGSEDSTMSFGKRSLHPHPLAKLLKVSETLLRKVPSAESLVRDRLAYKFGITMEKAFMTGSGASQPLGVFTASDNGIGTGQDVSTGNSGTAVTFDGLINAKYGLKAAYWPRSRWLAHRDFFKMVAKLKDGEGQYLWRQSVREGEPDMLLGVPAFISEYAPATFTSTLYVAIIGDFSNYWIADALDMRVQRLVELYAGANQIGLIGRMESDGMPVLAEAFVRVKLG